MAWNNWLTTWKVTLIRVVMQTNGPRGDGEKKVKIHNLWHSAEAIHVPQCNVPAFVQRIAYTFVLKWDLLERGGGLSFSVRPADWLKSKTNTIRKRLSRGELRAHTRFISAYTIVIGGTWWISKSRWAVKNLFECQSMLQLLRWSFPSATPAEKECQQYIYWRPRWMRAFLGAHEYRRRAMRPREFVI